MLVRFKNFLFFFMMLLIPVTGFSTPYLHAADASVPKSVKLYNLYGGGRPHYSLLSDYKAACLDLGGRMGATSTAGGVVEIYNIHTCYINGYDMSFRGPEECQVKNAFYTPAIRAACPITYSCPPKDYPDFTVKTDANGYPSSTGQLCARPCFPPFNYEGGECVAYCPPGKTLDYDYGQCISSKSKVPEDKQYCGNPVSVSDGEKVQSEEPDITSAGPFPLVFKRTYHSFASVEAESQYTERLYRELPDTEKAKWRRFLQPTNYNGPKVYRPQWPYKPEKVADTSSVGYKHWLNNYSYYLAERPYTTSVLLPNGGRVNFGDTSSTTGTMYSKYTVTPTSLSKVSDAKGAVQSWTYRDADNTQYVFSSSGNLVQIINPSGLSQRLTYDTERQIATIFDDFGNEFTFTYANERLTLVASNSGAQVSYTYDQYGNLVTVTKTSADGKTTTRQYHYEDTRFPYALTGITDERGIRYATWRYDSVGRAIESAHAGGADKTTFAYDINSTTVTNALGKSDIYRYAAVDDVRRLVSVDGQASTSCLAANKGYTYNSYGMLNTKTDQKGIVTRYEYNPRGLITKLTEAAGTPEQRVTITEWHPTLPLPTKVTQGTQVVTYTYDAQGRLLNRRIGN
jgi:YD repeat-containing protein